MAQEKKVPDWGKIELDYRAGIKPLRLIAEEHGITHGAINKRAKKEGWARDLKAKIVARAEELVSKAAVSKPVSTDTPVTKVTENLVVEANADLQFQVRMRHREDIKSLRSLFLVLLEELKGSSTPEGIDLIETMHDVVHGNDFEPSDKEGSRRAERMRELLQKALSSSGRITSAKILTEMLEKLVKLERQAFGIDDEENSASDLDKILAKIHGERAGA